MIEETGRNDDKVTGRLGDRETRLLGRLDDEVRR
jgi:hypothetical protein